MIKKKIIVIYGYHPIKEALLSNYIKILIVFINKNKIKKYKLLINNLNKKKIPIKIFNKFKLYKNIKNNQGIIANILIIKTFTLKDLVKTKKKLIILILYNITDTKNIGSIIRTSLCFNVDFIIIPNNYNIYNPNIIKISCGAIFKIPICRVKNIYKSIINLKKKKINIISITEKGNKNINNFKKKIYNNNIALILGNEETGISKNILDISIDKYYIPINNNLISSLNVSVACGIALYIINNY